MIIISKTKTRYENKKLLELERDKRKLFDLIEINVAKVNIEVRNFSTWQEVANLEEKVKVDEKTHVDDVEFLAKRLFSKKGYDVINIEACSSIDNYPSLLKDVSNKVFDLHNGSIPAGFPDLVLKRDDSIKFVEIKRKNEGLNRNQLEYFKQCEHPVFMAFLDYEVLESKVTHFKCFSCDSTVGKSTSDLKSHLKECDGGLCSKCSSIIFNIDDHRCDTEFFE